MKEPLISEEIRARAKLFESAQIDFAEASKVSREELEKIQDELLADKNLQGVLSIV